MCFAVPLRFFSASFFNGEKLARQRIPPSPCVTIRSDYLKYVSDHRSRAPRHPKNPAECHAQSPAGDPEPGPMSRQIKTHQRSPPQPVEKELFNHLGFPPRPLRRIPTGPTPGSLRWRQQRPTNPSERTLPHKTKPIAPRQHRRSTPNDAYSAASQFWLTGASKYVRNTAGLFILGHRH